MAVALTGEATTDDALPTAFTDDDAISTWQRPFVAAAVQAGYVSGSPDGDGGSAIRTEAYITRSEAAVILNAAGGIADVAADRTYTDDSQIPVWARQAAVNLDTLGILPSYSDGSMGLSGAMTRADAVEAMYRLWEYQSQQAENTGLFSWITGN